MPTPLNPQPFDSSRHSSGAARMIRLRRPAIVSAVEGPFVPAGVDLDEVDQRWEALRRRQPQAFDGRLHHVLGVHRNGYGGAVVHVVECAYRFYAVQDEALDLGVRPLGVKALTWRAGQVLMGLRSAAVMMYAGAWEFAPGGVAEVDQSPADSLRDELREETGLTLAAGGEPRAVAVLYDATSRTWELVHEIDAAEGEVKSSPEYDRVEWRTPGDWPAPLTPAAALMRPLVAG